MSAVITPFEGTELFNTASFNNRISQINTGFSYVSNPNLLDNWYFGNPVNQRGLTEYTGTTYTVDRWILTNANIHVKASELSISSVAYDNNFSQKIESKLWEYMVGKTITISFLVKNITGRWIVASGNNKIYGAMTEIGLHKFTDKLVESVTDAFHIFSLGGDAEGQIDIIAAKLELGSTQTLAHQENGQWVLNEVPEYGNQLRRCQRYFWRFSPPQYIAGAIAFGIDANTARAIIYLPEQMHTSPTLNLNASSGFFLTGASGDIFDVTVSSVWTNQNSVCVDFKKSGAFEVNAPYFVRGGVSSNIDISADL